MKRVIISCVGLEQYRGIVREEIQASIDRGEIRNYFYGGAPSSFDDFLELCFIRICLGVMEHPEFFYLPLSEGGYCLGRRMVSEDNPVQAQIESDTAFREQLVVLTKNNWDNVLIKIFFCSLGCYDEVPEISETGRLIVLNNMFSYKKEN